METRTTQKFISVLEIPMGKMSALAMWVYLSTITTNNVHEMQHLVTF